MIRPFGLLGLCGLLLAGCGSSTAEQYITYGKTVNEEICRRCPQTIGKTTEAECRAVFTISGDKEACVRRVVDANAQALEPYLSCYLKDYASQYHDCVNTQTCDAQLIQRCTQLVAPALQACGPLPTAAFEQLVACYQ